jgi:long-chain acyl-CoA synthetase
MNVATWLDRAARSHPQLPALALGDQTVASYERLARRSAGLAAGLQRRHRLSPGDRVVIAARNHPAYVETLFGVWWAGLVAVPVNAKLHPSEMAWIIGHSEARIVFVSPELEAAVTGVNLAGVQAVVSFQSSRYEILAKEAPAALVPRSPDDLAWLFYTSGTTGRPKGAMLTHHNLAAMSLAYLTDVDPTAPGDALLHAAPMSHGSGLYALPVVCRMALNAIPESGGFDPSEVLQLVRSRTRTSMFAAPTMIRRMVDCAEPIAPRTIRTMVWGGAPMHVPDVMRAVDRFGPCLAQIYGQGESPMTGTVLSKADIADREHPRWLERLGSAGVVNSTVELRVADDNDQPLPAGAAGELLIRGATVMLGYWRNPQATAETMRGGWLHTGDIAALDQEGYLTLKDRSKDVIISGGSNIYPREVEEVLLGDERIIEASVIGRPSREWGEVVVAYVVGEATKEQLDQLCLERIARFKRPRDYVFVSSLPKNNNGKILKTELRTLDAGWNSGSRVR